MPLYLSCVYLLHIYVNRVNIDIFFHNAIVSLYSNAKIAELIK